MLFARNLRSVDAGLRAILPSLDVALGSNFGKGWVSGMLVPVRRGGPGFVIVAAVPLIAGLLLAGLAFGAAAAACRRKSSAAANLVKQQMAAELPPGSGAQH